MGPAAADHADIRLPVYQSLHEQATRSGCELIAVGGIEDHVHVLLKMPTTVTIADVAQGLKGGSSHMVAQALRPGTFFKWQGSYGAFSVSSSHVPMVRNYVLNQERHHRENRPELRAGARHRALTPRKRSPRRRAS